MKKKIIISLIIAAIVNATTTPIIWYSRDIWKFEWYHLAIFSTFIFVMIFFITMVYQGTFDGKKN